MGGKRTWELSELTLLAGKLPAREKLAVDGVLEEAALYLSKSLYTRFRSGDVKKQENALSNARSLRMFCNFRSFISAGRSNIGLFMSGQIIPPSLSVGWVTCFGSQSHLWISLTQMKEGSSLAWLLI